MNIWRVKTEVWQRSRIKLDASKRHSDGYFLEVNSKRVKVKNALKICAKKRTHHDRDSADQAEALQETDIFCHQLFELLTFCTWYEGGCHARG